MQICQIFHFPHCFVFPLGFSSGRRSLSVLFDMFLKRQLQIIVEWLTKSINEGFSSSIISSSLSFFSKDLGFIIKGEGEREGQGPGNRLQMSDSPCSSVRAWNSSGWLQRLSGKTDLLPSQVSSTPHPTHTEGFPFPSSWICQLTWNSQVFLHKCTALWKIQWLYEGVKSVG